MNVTINSANGQRVVKLYAKELNHLLKARGILAALAGIQEPNAAEALGALDKLIPSVQQATAAETPILTDDSSASKVPTELPFDLGTEAKELATTLDAIR